MDNFAEQIKKVRNQTKALGVAIEEFERFSEALAASRAENARLRRRRNEIDDEAEEYAEQVEHLRDKLEACQESLREHMAMAGRLRHAVELGAKQKLPEEVSEEGREDADYEHGYVAMVKLCRAALAGKEEAK